jgi:hypothetical protein
VSPDVADLCARRDRDDDRREQVGRFALEHSEVENVVNEVLGEPDADDIGGPLADRVRVAIDVAYDRGARGEPRCTP